MAVIPLLRAILALHLASALPCLANEPFTISGATVAYPFLTQAAGVFAQANPGLPAPVIKTEDSNAGLASFCTGATGGTGAAALASSRPITDKERAECASKGVTDIAEIKFGYDAVVFVTDAKGPKFAFEPRDIFLSIAKDVAVNGAIIPNPYRDWAAIDAKFPQQPIVFLLPSHNLGTREVFIEKVMMEGCSQSGTRALFAKQNEIRRLRPKFRFRAIANKCRELRIDGIVREVDDVGVDANTVRTVTREPNIVAVAAFALYENNTDKLRVASLRGVAPTQDTIANGSYMLARPLYLYVDRTRVLSNPGLRAFLSLFLSEKMIGEDGELVQRGLVALSPQEASQTRQTLAAFMSAVPQLQR